jgi:hypothetical protein
LRQPSGDLAIASDRLLPGQEERGGQEHDHEQEQCAG